MIEMKKYKIKDFAKTCSGGTPTSSRREFYEGGTIPWINSGELSQSFITNTSNYITELGYNSSSAKMFPKDDTVLLAMYGATAGKASLLQINACTNQAICAIIPDKSVADPLYLKYKLDTMYDYLVRLSSGSARDNLSQAGIANLEVDLPPLSVQQKVASVLSSLDKKIALNKQINQNLEALARQLYDYWFVQFDFPNEEGKPYKSSSGKMVYNPILKREIPEGWEVKKLGEVENKIITGKTPSTSDPENFGGDIPFITIDDIRKAPYIYTSERTLTNKGANTQRGKFLPAGSLCCSCIGTPGVIGFVGIEAQTNQQINTIVFDNVYNREFVYYALHWHFSTSTAKMGNILPNMSKEEFSQIQMVYPSEDIVKLYHSKVNHIFEEIDNRVQQIISLTKQRDELLPLLMNGQVNFDLSDD